MATQNEFFLLFLFLFKLSRLHLRFVMHPSLGSTYKKLIQGIGLQKIWNNWLHLKDLCGVLHSFTLTIDLQQLLDSSVNYFIIDVIESCPLFPVGWSDVGTALVPRDPMLAQQHTFVMTCSLMKESKLRGLSSANFIFRLTKSTLARGC